MTQLKITSVAVLAATALASCGVVALGGDGLAPRFPRRPGRTDASASAPPPPPCFAGRVPRPTEKPVREAQLDRALPRRRPGLHRIRGRKPA